jgi:membrane protein
MSAAVSFYALISLIPLVFLAFQALTLMIGSSEVAHEQLYATLREYLVPQTADALMGRVDELTSGELFASQNAWWIVLSFLWAGISFYEALGGIFTAAWGGAAGRRYWHRKLSALAAFVVAAAFFGMTIILSTFMATVPALSQEYLGVRIAPGLIFLGGRLIPLVLSIGIFFLLYKFLPNANVPWRLALYTAIPVGIIWELTKWIFTQLLVISSMYSSVYGPMAGFAVLMIWIYWSSNVVLLGAEFGAAWQHDREPYYPEVG